MQALIVNPPGGCVPQNTTDLLDDIGWGVITTTNFTEAVQHARTTPFDAVVMAPPETNTSDHTHAEFETFLRLIDSKRIAAVLVTDDPESVGDQASLLIDVVNPNVSAGELRGRFAMIERYQQVLSLMERELRSMERLGKRLNRHFHEVDQEMRLAGRLQRDFLPKLDEPFHNIRFASLYRPASWVSGDIFDVLRIDEDHTAFYIADAVGHGMAASLLTMFIKRAVIPNRGEGENRQILSPSEVMVALNESLVEQSLPNCQFVTACYAVFDHKTLTLEYVRGGHPAPILMAAGGGVSDLKASGSLLGLFSGEVFVSHSVRLRPGDKLLLYTDGVELAFQPGGGEALDTTAYHREFEKLSHLPIHKMLKQIESRLDDDSGSLTPKDDVTLLAMEVLHD